MSEKIVQIAACTASEGVGAESWEALYALTDQGNVYIMPHPKAGENVNETKDWMKLPPLPAAEKKEESSSNE